MDPSALWQLTPEARAEALALLPSVLGLLVPFLGLNLILLPRSALFAVLLSLYSYGSTVFWLNATNSFASIVDPIVMIMSLLTPCVLVGSRARMEGGAISRRAFWLG